MAANWSGEVLMGQSFGLDSGVRVRLRLARFSDVKAITELFARQGGAPDGLEPERLVQFDPRSRYVVCATALIGGLEELVGIGAINLDGELGQPELMIVAPELGEDLADLMRRALTSVAQAAVRAPAA